jgi:cytochrome c-type biogenesis protein CcmH/NrfG
MRGRTRQQRRLTAVLTASLLLAGCDFLGLGHRQTTSQTAPPLSAIVRAWFANRYADAEGMFKNYIAQNPRSVEGHARFALFLNYQQRFDEANAEITQATKIAPKDGLALAIATRVKDWSAKSPDDIKRAAAVGADAIRYGPRLPLSHTFLSEALADEGKGDEAAKQIEAARPLLGKDPYEKAELEREQANLAHDTGAVDRERDHLLSAQAIQSGWAERTKELAGFFYAHGPTDRAIAEFHKAIALAPRDVSLRIDLGTAALEQLDVATANEAFAGANDLKPHRSQVEMLLAVTDFNIHHDTAKAEELLRAAHDDAPGNDSAALLLWGFLRYIKGDASAAAEVTIGTVPDDPRGGRTIKVVTPDDLEAKDREAALAAVNAARAKAQLPPAHQESLVDQGATSHAFYWIFNLANPGLQKLEIHHELPGTPGFTGRNMQNRAVHFGFAQASMAEDITHSPGGPTGAISDWVDSVYHRFPIMRSDMSGVGFGDAGIGLLTIQVMDMSYSDHVSQERLMTPYPADGQTDVPEAFFDNELPDPIPPGAPHPSGYPITLNFNPFVRVNIANYRINTPSGNALPAYVVYPQIDNDNVLSLLPATPLKAGTTYDVHVTGVIHGVSFSKDWSFTTAST